MPKLPDKGTAAIVWDPDGDNIVFKKAFEDIVFKDEEITSEVFEAQFGQTPVDEFTEGVKINFEAVFTREDIEKLATFCVGATVSGTTSKQIEFSVPVGESKYQYAKQVIIKPMVNQQPVSDESQWLYLYKCFPGRAFEIGFGTDQKKFSFNFKVFPDQDEASPTYGKTHRFGTAAA
ncbi:MAG: hypothetical protein KAW12_07265 [Candidatus Aminicenantes bacterium]|nr:hypothetical protein [Candidatus Aminicenantes bacterium]